MYVSLTRKKAVEVESLSAASLAVRKFIELNDLGSSDFEGGGIYESLTNRLIAKVSYNGRTWDAQGSEISSLFAVALRSALPPATINVPSLSAALSSAQPIAASGNAL